MIQMKSFNFILILLLFNTTLYSQNTVTGTVVSDEGEKIEYATIRLQSIEGNDLDHQFTNELGVFIFDDLKVGDYQLLSSMTGFSSDTTQVSISNLDTPTQVYIRLSSSISLSEVVVETTRPLYEKKIDRTIINVENSVISKGSDVLSILNRSPGVNVDQANQEIQMQGNSGVIVMVNGKQIRMEGRSLVQFLQGMTADNIESIELINSPPASMEAQGNAGIINIITKSKTTEGLSHNFSVNTGYGNRGKIGGSYAINYQKGKFNAFGDVSANYQGSLQSLSLDRINSFNSIETQTSIYSTRPATMGNYTYRLGLDYKTSERTTIGGLFSGYFTTWDLDAITQSEVIQSNDEYLFSDLSLVEQNDWTHWMGNINLRHQLKDSSLVSIDFDYLDYIDRNPTTYNDQGLDINQNQIYLQNFNSNKETPITFQVLKVDYSKQLSPILKLETGLKGTSTYFENDIELTNIGNGLEAYQDQFSDNFLLQEDLGAAYLSFDYSRDKLSLKAGGRYEYYSSDLTSEKQGDVLLQDYGRLFPSAYAKYQLNEKQSLQFAYSERIQRPSINWIAPAFFYWGHNSFLGGNPDILPALSRNLDLSYLYKELSISVQLNHQRDAVTWQPTVFSEDNTTLMRTENLEYRKQASLNLYVPWKITSWWESSYTTNGFLRKVQPKIGEQNFGANNSSYYDLQTNHTFLLPKDYTVEISGRYTSDFDLGLGVFKSRHQFDFGTRKQLSANSQISITGSDLFKTGSQFHVYYNEPELNLLYDQIYRVEPRVIRVSFSHNFGDTSVKKKNTRATGSDEEQNRMR